MKLQVEQEDHRVETRPPGLSLPIWELLVPFGGVGFFGVSPLYDRVKLKVELLGRLLRRRKRRGRSSTSPTRQSSYSRITMKPPQNIFYVLRIKWSYCRQF